MDLKLSKTEYNKLTPPYKYRYDIAMSWSPPFGVLSPKQELEIKSLRTDEKRLFRLYDFYHMYSKFYMYAYPQYHYTSKKDVNYKLNLDKTLT